MAAELESEQIGHQTQERRARRIIDRIIGDPALHDDARLAQMKDDLINLSNVLDDIAIRAMQAHFPDLSVEFVLKDPRPAFYVARVDIWSEVYSYVHSSGEYPPQVRPPPLAEYRVAHARP